MNDLSSIGAASEQPLAREAELSSIGDGALRVREKLSPNFEPGQVPKMRVTSKATKGLLVTIA